MAPKARWIRQSPTCTDIICSWPQQLRRSPLAGDGLVVVLAIPDFRSKSIARQRAPPWVRGSVRVACARMQAGRANRIALVDDVIENNGAEGPLDQTVADLHRHYLQLATTTP